MAEAKRQFDALEFDKVQPLAEAVLAREDVPVDLRMEAHLLLGSALCIVGDPVQAEKQFRFLLRGRPDFEMAANVSPKIVAIFRKVQAEENAFREQLAALEHERTVASLAIETTPPAEGEGGKPLAFDIRLQDPSRAVDKVNVFYRRQGEPAFSSLALKLDDEGIWRGAIPGEWTANDDGAQVEYYLTTVGRRGEKLLAQGAPDSPQRIVLAPGSVDVPLYREPWFWALAGGVAIALGVTTWVLIDNARSVPDSPLGVHDIGK